MMGFVTGTDKNALAVGSCRREGRSGGYLIRVLVNGSGELSQHGRL